MLTAASCLSKDNEVHVFWNENILKKASEKFDIDLTKVKLSKNIFDVNIGFPKRFSESRKYDKIIFLSDGSLPLIATKLYVHFQFPVEWVNAGSLINRLKVSRTSKFICNSAYTKQFIDERFNIKSVVLYPPTLFVKDLPKTNYKTKKNIILNVGRLSSLPDGTLFKKQNFLVESFRKLQNPDWELVLVVSFLDSDKPLVAKLKEESRGLNVRIIENCSFETLREIYQEAKIYWHASGFGENLKHHPERAEHFGISTVEAMANGAVPVVINEGGQKEIVENEKNGFLFDSQNELIEKTKTLSK